MKAAADICFPGASKSNVKPGSYSRNLNVGGLVAALRHLAIVLRGGGWHIYIYIHIHIYIYACTYTYIYNSIYIYI